MEIVRYPSQILALPAVTVVDFNDKIAVADVMFETMYKAKGVGLAAPQIGIPLRIVAIDLSVNKDPTKKIVLCNPDIISQEGEQEVTEGCLSVPGFRGKTKRPKRATVRAQNLQGEWFEITGEDLLACAFAHEIDHLGGRLFLTRIGGVRRSMIERQIKKLIRAKAW